MTFAIEKLTEFVRYHDELIDLQVIILNTIGMLPPIVLCAAFSGFRSVLGAISSQTLYYSLLCFLRDIIMFVQIACAYLVTPGPARHLGSGVAERQTRHNAK
jgi:hypothetical protein